MPQLKDVLNQGFLSLIDVTIQELVKQKLTVVGLLASPTTIKSKLYEKATAEVGIRLLVPSGNEQEIVEEAIRSVIANQHPNNAKILTVANDLAKRGAQKVILGCSELSVLLAGVDTTTLIDPLTIVTKQLFGRDTLNEQLPDKALPDMCEAVGTLACRLYCPIFPEGMSLPERQAVLDKPEIATQTTEPRPIPFRNRYACCLGARLAIELGAKLRATPVQFGQRRTTRTRGTL